MAQLPVPGRSSPEPGLSDGGRLDVDRLPGPLTRAINRLAAAGHEAALVGGCVRDLLRGERPGDWDVATSAQPAEVSALFPGSSWENRFGTVTLSGPVPIEITTYRSESGYTDRRRPNEVTFHDSLETDLGRRDFTINAIGWLPDLPDARSGRLVDPHDGLGDLRRGRVRAVGRPADRFAEDALRVLRGVRFSLKFGFEIDPATDRALTEAVALTAGLSTERVRDELLRLLADESVAPSIGLRRWESLGLLALHLPELARLRGVPQDKPRSGDALDHSLWTADALPAHDPVMRVAGLFHDLGKADTLAGGHFVGHETVGSDLAEAAMRRLRFGSADTRRVRDLVRHHMFGYDASWSDAAVRRLIGRVGSDALEDLFELREADNRASGVEEPASGGLAELRRRVAEQREAPVASSHLAVDGHDLQRELGLAPGPEVGRVLGRLLEAVVEDPARNERGVLLRLARQALDER